jgi:hypothetical protein
MDLRARKSRPIRPICRPLWRDGQVSASLNPNDLLISFRVPPLRV